MTAPLTPDELDSLETVVGRMTPGPLKTVPAKCGNCHIEVSDPVTECGAVFAAWLSPDNAEAVVAIHNAFPRLAAAARQGITLAAKLAEAERLLRPFAKEVRPFSADRGADGWDGAPHDCPLHLYSRCWNGNVGVTVGDCLAAAAFLAQTTPIAAAPQEK